MTTKPDYSRIREYCEKYNKSKRSGIAVSVEELLLFIDRCEALEKVLESARDVLDYALTAEKFSLCKETECACSYRDLQKLIEEVEK